jgi:peptide deformylase
MLEILKYPDPRLKQVSQPVVSFDKSLHQLLDGMAEAMYAADGVGLAAPQVAAFIRVFIVDIGANESEPRPELYEFINPKLSNGSGKISFEEGCLSVPGIAEEVSRYATITIDFQDRYGKTKSIDAQGLFAVALQHENDHLDGILFVERLSGLKRQLIKRKLSKVVTL